MTWVEGTDFNDVFYGDSSAEWLEFRPGDGIDFLIGSDDGTEVIRHQEATFLTTNGTQNLLDDSDTVFGDSWHLNSEVSSRRIWLFVVR